MTYDGNLSVEMANRYREAQPLQQQWWYEADLDMKMYLGQQDYWNQLYTVNFRNQRTLQFNKILRVINMISGYQRKNRHTTICTPIENADNKTSDQFTALLMWAMNQDDTYEKISDSFDGANITGMNMLSVWMDYRDDPENGDIRCSRIPYSSFIMDPYWKNADLSDCEWIWNRRYLSKKQIMGIVPNVAEKEIENLKQPGNQSVDGKFLYLPENRQMYNQNFYAYDEYWTKEYKNIDRFLDTYTGEVMDIPMGMDDEKLELFLKTNKKVKTIRSRMLTCKLHVLVNDHVVWEEIEPYGITAFPFIPFLCYHFFEAQDYSYRYQGVVRNIRDSQIELNKRRNKFFDILDSQINSGLIVKEDALVDPEDAFLAGQGRVLFLKETANIADVQQVPAPQIPPSMFELTKMLDEEIMAIAGATEELFGETDGKDTSGFMVQLRMGAGLVSLQNIFDKLRQSQRNLGNMFIQLMQKNFSPGKVRRILNEEPSEQFRTQNFHKYDCVVEEGILTSTQRQMEFIQLLQLRETGIPVPIKHLLQASTLQKKDDLVKAIEQEEQQQAQKEQEIHRLEMENKALITRSMEAKAQNDFASAQERQGRTISNIGLYTERESERAQNLASAALDQAKAMTEISKLDRDSVMETARFILELQRAQKELASDVEMKGVQVADFVGKDVDIAKKETELPQKQEAPGVEGAIDQRIEQESPV